MEYSLKYGDSKARRKLIERDHTSTSGLRVRRNTPVSAGAVEMSKAPPDGAYAMGNKAYSGYASSKS